MLADKLPYCLCGNEEKQWVRRGVYTYKEMRFQPYICDACRRIAVLIPDGNTPLYCCARDARINRDYDEGQQCATFLHDVIKLIPGAGSRSGSIPLRKLVFHWYDPDAGTWTKFNPRAPLSA